MSMKKLAAAFILAMVLPLKGFADTPYIYQPPTPVQKYIKTPGAQGSENMGVAVDEFGRQIMTGGTGSLVSPATEMTPIPMVTVLPTAIPTAFSTPQYPGSADSKAAVINNQFNVDVWCDYGVGTPAPFTVPAQTQYTSNFASKGLKMGSPIRCIRPANTPASGTLQIWGEK